MRAKDFGSLRLWLWFVVASLCALIVYETLNFTGFCYEQKRYLSDEELINAAVRYEIGEQYNLHAHNIDDRPAWTRRYISVEEFHHINPNCCFVHRWGFPGNYGEGIWTRIFGWYVALVDLQFRTRDTGPKQFYSAAAFVNACGAVGETFGTDSTAPASTMSK